MKSKIFNGRAGVVMMLMLLSILFFPSMKVWAAESITLKIYTSKEAFENKEEPYLTWTENDGKESWGSYEFEVPDIPVQDGYEIDKWRYVSSDGWENSFYWSIYPSEGEGNIYSVYPVLREVKSAYTVEFYDSNPRYGSAKLLSTTEVANMGRIPSSALPDISVPEGSVVSQWNYAVKQSDGSYSGGGIWKDEYYSYNGGGLLHDVVKYDIALYPEIESIDSRDFWIYIAPARGKDYSSAFEEIETEYSLSDATQFGEEYYIKLSFDDIPDVENYIFDCFKLSVDSSILPVFSKDGDTFTKLTERSYVSIETLDNVYLKVYDKFGFYEVSSLFINLEYIPSKCTVTIKDSYYDTDGTTLIESVIRSTEEVAGGTTYTLNPLNPTGYTYAGNISSTSIVVKGNITYNFKYIKKDTTTSGGRIDIPVEIEADGTTKTDFVADNTILGGDLIVSIPAEMILAYDADNEVMTKADYVSATGRCASTSKLEVKTLTSITYANDDDNSITVSGTIAFGNTSDDHQITEWSALELLTGVKTPADVVKKDITASVLKSDIDYVGTYSTSILYNISVLDTVETEGA